MQILGLILYAFSVTFAVIDCIMSIDPPEALSPGEGRRAVLTTNLSNSNRVVASVCGPL